jgi:hypothetical protein
MFENYPKPTNYALLGRQQGSVAFPTWWTERKTLGAYPDTIVHDKYPLTMLYDYYSANIPPAIKSPRMGYGVYTFFRQYIDAENLTTVATGANKAVYFIPTWSGNAPDDGGSVTWNWYTTYLTNQECSDITAGVHYANTYYNVPAGAVGFGGSNANDGWWAETQGIMSFDRAAAHKFLNLPKVGTDLRTDFDTNNTGNAIGNAWAAMWTLNGTSNAPIQGFNIYTTYDWEIDSGQVVAYLSRDPSSTAANLVLRLWGIAWGYEILWERYLDSQRLMPLPAGKGAGIADYFQGYPEDFYLNGTASSNGADIHVRQTLVYKMLAWKDNSPSSVWGPAAWNLPTVHTDACANTLAVSPAGPTTWTSRYNLYQATSTANFPPKMEWSPGTVNYGTNVMFWQSFHGYNVSAWDNVTIKLPSAGVLGYNPYRGALDTINDAKVIELNSNMVWGELVLGHGYPSWLYSSSASGGKYTYNNVTKTIRMQGPLTINDVPNPVPGFPRRNATSSPDFVFAVSKVSYYDVEITTPGPYNAGIQYTLRVTAKNISGNAVTDWNGTVNLATNNLLSTWGANGSSHTFVAPNNGVWWTTITFGTPNKVNTYVNATDSRFALDVFWAGPNQNVNGGSISIGTLIPEFPTLLIPVMGMAAAVVVVARRRKKT